MPPIDTPFVIPAADREKIAKSAEKDFYEDMTDEERVEEGIPPRSGAESPNADATPKAEAEAEKPPVAAKSPEAEVDPGREVDPEIQALFEEIAGLREDLGAAIGDPEGDATTEEPDPLLAQAKDHEDPVVRGLADRLERAESRLAQTERATRVQAIDTQKRLDDVEFADVQANTLINGQPMTDQHMELVEDFMLEHPEVARQLSIAQVTRVVFPEATRAGKPSSPAKPGAGIPPKATGDQAPTATIVDAGSSGGAPAQPFRPRPNETIESAVAAAGKRFGWTK